MRLSVIFCLAGLVNTTLAAALLGGSSAFDSVSSISGHKRAFGGFDGFLGGLNQPTDTAAAHEHAATDLPAGLPAGDPTAPQLLPTPLPLTTTPAGGKKEKATGTATGTASSSNNAQATSSPTSSANPAPATASARSSSAASAGGSSSSPGGTSEWKIIGVAVIAFSTVAAILLLSVFFDHWWRFVRDLLWRRRRGTDGEELVPDWEKAEWELRFEDRQRYPSFSSLPSVPIVHPGVGAGMNANAIPNPIPNAYPESAMVVSPPQAAVGVGAGRRDMQAYGKGPVRPMDGLGLRSPSGSVVSRSNSTRSAATVGLGLGRVGSTRSVAHNMRMAASSPQLGGGPGGPSGRSPAPQYMVQNGQGGLHARGGGNPFEDPNSPMPDDVYGGMA